MAYWTVGGQRWAGWAETIARKSGIFNFLPAEKIFSSAFLSSAKHSLLVAAYNSRPPAPDTSPRFVCLPLCWFDIKFIKSPEKTTKNRKQHAAKRRAKCFSFWHEIIKLPQRAGWAQVGREFYCTHTLTHTGNALRESVSIKGMSKKDFKRDLNVAGTSRISQFCNFCIICIILLIIQVRRSRSVCAMHGNHMCGVKFL